MTRLSQIGASGSAAHRCDLAPPSLSLGALWLVLALVHAPYVRTLEPAGVIEDPALMLMFVAVLAAVNTLLRWTLHHVVALTVVTEIDTRRVWTWLLCRPHPSVVHAVDDEISSWATTVLDEAREAEVDWAPPSST
jgi:hypothetical protein